MKTRAIKNSKRVVLVIILSIFVNVAFAQNRHSHSWNLNTLNYGVSYSANGLGMQHEIGAGFGLAHKQIDINLISGSKFYNFNGLQLSYKYFFAPKSESTNIYCSLLGNVRFKSELTTELNQLMHESDFNGSYEKFNTFELGAGFGIKQYIVFGISLDASLHFEYYDRQIASSKDARIVDYPRFSSDSSIGMIFKFGITYDFE